VQAPKCGASSTTRRAARLPTTPSPCSGNGHRSRRGGALEHASDGQDAAGCCCFGRRCIAFAGLSASTARQQDPQAPDCPRDSGKQAVISAAVTPSRKESSRWTWWAKTGGHGAPPGAPGAARRPSQRLSASPPDADAAPPACATNRRASSPVSACRVRSGKASQAGAMSDAAQRLGVNRSGWRSGVRGRR